MRRSKFEWLLAAAIIAYFGGVALFWLLGSPAAFGVFERVQGVLSVWGPWQTQPYAHAPLPFVDLQGPISWRECYLRGIDVTETNPCDVIARGPANYSPIIWQLPLEWLGFRNLIPAALTLGGIFLFVIWRMFQPRNMADLGIAFLGAISPPVFFVLERGNLDMLVFIAVLSTLLLSQSSFRARAVFYFAALAAGLLKLYPFALFVMLVREPAKRCVALSVIASTLMAVYFASNWGYFMHLWLPEESIFAMFGGRLLAKAIQEHFSLGEVARPAIYVLCCAVSILGIYFIAKRIGDDPVFQNTTDAPNSLILCGSILVLACFFTGFNVYYRAIFLLPLLSGFLSLLGEKHHGATGKLVWLGVLMTGLCLYGDMIRFGGMAFILSRIFVEPASIFGQVLILVVIIGKEAFWWLEVTLLGGIVCAILLQSRAVENVRDAIVFRGKTPLAAKVAGSP